MGGDAYRAPLNQIAIFQMNNCFISLSVLAVTLVSNGFAKCISRPDIQADVIVQSCLAVTFQPSDLCMDLGRQETPPVYKRASRLSGALLSVTVKISHFVWRDPKDRRVNEAHLWAPEK